VAWDTLSPDLAFLPPLTNLAGLPASAMSCACSAISWTEFATMLTADGFGEILGAIGGGDAPDRSSPAVLSGLQLNGLLDGGRRLADGAADGALSPLCAYADNWDAVTAEQCAAWVEVLGCDAVWAAGCPGMTAPDGTDGSALRLGSGCPSQCPAYALEDVVSIPGVAAALRSVIKYPAFLLSGDGVCAAGCSEPFKQVTQYVLDVATAVLGRDASLQPVSSAVAEISASDLHTCTCGGSLDWDALVAGVSSAIDAFATKSPLEVPGMLLGAVFGPSFLCSSPTCKAITGDFMNVISSLSGVLAPDGTGTGSDGSDGSEDVIGDALAAVGDIELCPADAGSAGFSLKQTFVLLETLESFSPAKQEEFKARFVTELNKGTTTIIKLTTSSVTLAIRPGSINVDAEIACSQPDLAEQVQTQMDTMASTDTAELSTRLGVEVAAPPTKSERGSIAASEPQSIGGGDDGDDGDKTLIIILSIVGALSFVCRLR